MKKNARVAGWLKTVLISVAVIVVFLAGLALLGQVLFAFNPAHR